ncbi:MAG: hypothetical protein CVV48_08000 [Spirochaetae bacterium HGW-Spirochaetae-4]|jgi:hypothetical protein|nr:MAG: hypothetical protein CVV48_08000 [Spirochaetae bacterium HGW-Spirochaetae-4]
MNGCIWELVDKLNASEFKKKDGSRLLLFSEKEQKELLPLPPKPFELFERCTATVALDYHIEFANAFYSVSPKFIKSQVLVKGSTDKVFIHDKRNGNLIAEHPRCRFRGQRSTLAEHIPERHSDYIMWSADYFLSHARRIGPATEQMVVTIIASREYEVQSYRSCAGILRLVKRFGSSCLEHACLHALESGLHSYKAVSTIAKTLKDTIATSPMADAEGSVADESSLGALYCSHDAGGGQ